LKKNKLSVVFRVDASIEIGIGHVMRCLTLADALSQSGAKCIFICRVHMENQISFICKHGYTAYGLPDESDADKVKISGMCDIPAHASWLKTTWEIDADQTLRVLDDMVIDWLIVDHYALDARWEGRLRSVCNKLMVIDDLADRKHDCDLLLDQNLGRVKSDYAQWLPDGCTVCTGSFYALLRPEFAELRDYSLRRRESPQLKQLLITMGGIDKDNVTSQVLESIKSSGLPVDCRICVVMGGDAPWLDAVRSLAASMPWPTEVQVNVKNIAELMAGSDLAIGAAGSTSWERCCLGLPTLLIILAENQKKIGEELELCGAAIPLYTKTLGEGICESVGRFCSHPYFLTQMASRACSVADGMGVQRVVQKLSSLKVAA